LFTGHYSFSFAGKRAEKRIPLWLLFLAVQWIDMMWSIFVLLGIEKVRIVPGITASNALDLYYMRYTHSLAGVLCWSVLAYVVCRIVPSLRGVRTELILAAAVFSHWILDLIVHRPDSRFMTAWARWGLACGTIAAQPSRWKWECCLVARRCCIESQRIEVGSLDLRFFSPLFRSLGHSSSHRRQVIILPRQLRWFLTLC